MTLLISFVFVHKIHHKIHLFITSNIWSTSKIENSKNKAKVSSRQDTVGFPDPILESRWVLNSICLSKPKKLTEGLNFIVCIPPPFCWLGGWTSYQIFKKWVCVCVCVCACVYVCVCVAWKDHNFKGGLLGKMGVNFLRGWRVAIFT